MTDDVANKVADMAVTPAAGEPDFTIPEFTEEDVLRLMNEPVREYTLQERYMLARSVAEECVQDHELIRLLHFKQVPIAYDGFEPSGRMHIAQGIRKSILVNRLTRAGCRFVFWVADWFAFMNNKMGGDHKKIRAVGEYLIEVWRAAGMDLANVEFIWSSEEINSRAAEYWPLVLDISRTFNLARITRCSQIMGRTEKDDLAASQIFYPCMQCADIFFLKADICQLGLDQRKVNVLAREYCDAKKIKRKPVILSHHMLMGLKEGQEKMSKSDPDSAIFMEDSEAEVKTKIKKAFCPPQVIEKNPCVEYVRYVVIPSFGRFEVSRNEKNGGDIAYTDMAALEADYLSGALHPGDLKPALAAAINRLLDPIRQHFASGEPAALLKRIKQYRTTR